ncbi:MAG: glycosyl hydrolase 108 family protein [Bacteroidales bacterium]
MATFDLALKKILKNEGGYVNDPLDPGGETYRGISRNNWPKWDGWLIIDTTKPDIPDRLLEGKVSEFYRKNFWNKIKGDGIRDQDVAESICDFAVNAGVVTASKCAQRAVCANDDGVIDDGTLKALNCVIPELFVLRFTLEKINHYIKICERNSTQKKYFFGWVRRAVS